MTSHPKPYARRIEKDFRTYFNVALIFMIYSRKMEEKTTRNQVRMTY
jgi:hypothetical protein